MVTKSMTKRKSIINFNLTASEVENAFANLRCNSNNDEAANIIANSIMEQVDAGLLEYSNAKKLFFKPEVYEILKQKSK